MEGSLAVHQGVTCDADTFFGTQNFVYAVYWCNPNGAQIKAVAAIALKHRTAETFSQT